MIGGVFVGMFFGVFFVYGLVGLFVIKFKVVIEEDVYFY